MVILYHLSVLEDCEVNFQKDLYLFSLLIYFLITSYEIYSNFIFPNKFIVIPHYLDISLMFFYINPGFLWELSFKDHKLSHKLFLKESLL